jgi:hypothetical protein
MPLSPPYYLLRQMVLHIDEPNHSACLWFLEDNKELLKEAPGGGGKHQAWPGGYLDHVTEVMNIGWKQYELLSSLRPLSFSRADVLLVLFIHDLEKPWRYRVRASGGYEDLLPTKEEQNRVRDEKIRQYGFQLTPEQEQALRYVEGEGSDYTPGKRLMNGLGAVCHTADTLSARLWSDYPLVEKDPWGCRGMHD